MKTGIIGGTFNPIHLGHLILAEEIRESAGLDRIIFIPVFRPPHKDCRDVISPAHRLTMLKLAVRGNAKFSVSDLELRRKGVSYTIDTLLALRKKYPGDKFFLIIGSDLLEGLSGWKNFSGLKKVAGFIVARRPGYPDSGIPPKGAISVKTRAIDISAFDIRARIKKGLQVRYFLPQAVCAYITREKLYK
jgi:nicotinate-nucleotide adenylyltransferase